MQNHPFKIGINIGRMKGQREFSTDIEHPPFAVNQANQYIRDNFEDRFELVFRERQEQRRRSRRRG